MTTQEAYKTLDLAKGLSMDRVEAQFTKLKAEMESKMASTSNERLKQVYSNRLDEIEEAYATLIESLQGGSGHADERVEIVSDQSSSIPTKPANPKWLLPVALIFVGIVGLIALFLFFNANSENNGQTEESKNGTENNSTDNQYTENEDVDTRVAKIKEWYSSIQSMINLSKCENVQRIKYEQDGFNDYGIEMEFQQDVRICNVNNEFEVLNGSFRGYESSYQISIYKRYGKIFFVFINGGSEGYSFEERYYADNQEILIKHLIKEAYNGDRLPTQNTEVEVKDKQLIKDKISDQLDDVNWVLKAR
jgi:hypothetical protein